MKEQRRHKRVSAQGIAAYIQVDDMSASAIIENISAGGIFIRTARPMLQHTPVQLNLARPGMRKPLLIGGMVVSTIDQETAAKRGSPPGMGIAFDPIGPDTGRRLERILKDLGLPGLPDDFARLGEEVPPAAPFLPPRSRYAPKEPSLVTELPGELIRPPGKAVSFKLEVPKARVASPAETSRLMNHIRGLLSQLAETEERVTIRNRQLVLANEEIEQLRAELDEKKKQIQVLLGGKSK